MTYTCQTPFFNAKQLSKRPNFWNLALKMPTWQPSNSVLYLVENWMRDTVLFFLRNRKLEMLVVETLSKLFM